MRIATTRVAHGPVPAGIFRPVFLLPESMAGALTPRQLKLVITHRLLADTFAATESNSNRRIRRILSGRHARMTLRLSLATGAGLILIGVLGLPTVTSAPSLEPSQYAAASFSDLKSSYAK